MAGDERRGRSIRRPDYDRMDPHEVHAMVRRQVEAQGLVGMVPSDGPRYGIRTGSANEWANYFTGLAMHESGLKNSTVGDVGHFDGGSRGLFQLSYHDAKNYGLNGGKAFTPEQLANPETNTAAAVAITKQLVTDAGSIRGGAGKYWGPVSKEGWTPGRGRDWNLPWQTISDTGAATAAPRSVSPYTPVSMPAIIPAQATGGSAGAGTASAPSIPSPGTAAPPPAATSTAPGTVPPASSPTAPEAAPPPPSPPSGAGAGVAASPPSETPPSTASATPFETPASYAASPPSQTPRSVALAPDSSASKGKSDIASKGKSILTGLADVLSGLGAGGGGGSKAEVRPVYSEGPRIEARSPGGAGTRFVNTDTDPWGSIRSIMGAFGNGE